MGNCTDFQEWMTSLVFPSGCGLMTVNGAQAAGGRGLPWRASSPLGPCGHLLPGDGAIHGPRPLRTRSEPSLQRIMVVLPMGLVLQRTLTPPPSLEAHSLFLIDDHLCEQRSASVCWARRPPLPTSAARLLGAWEFYAETAGAQGGDGSPSGRTRLGGDVYRRRWRRGACWPAQERGRTVSLPVLISKEIKPVPPKGNQP